MEPRYEAIVKAVEDGRLEEAHALLEPLPWDWPFTLSEKDRLTVWGVLEYLANETANRSVE